MLDMQFIYEFCTEQKKWFVPSELGPQHVSERVIKICWKVKAEGQRFTFHSIAAFAIHTNSEQVKYCVC